MSDFKQNRKPLVVLMVVALALGIGVALAVHVLNSPGQTTNDAFVSADFTVVAPRVTGQVTALAVEDNQVVHKGQLLAQIDDRDYAALTASAEANVAMAAAAVDNVSASIAQQQSVISQASAALTAARAACAYAEADFTRYTDLARKGAGSVQNEQQARSRIASARADVSRSDAGLEAATQQVAILQAERERAVAALRHAEAVLDGARLNLSWTRIEAPVDGTVGQRSARVGAYVTAGNALMAIVPLQKAYVVANFQETQLSDVRPGQDVDVRVDTWPGLVLRGTVDSFAPATGVTFAPIAPDNATGNFTKVVQRIPVKIVLQYGQPMLDRLRVGMSVKATIHTESRGASAESKVALR